MSMLEELPDFQATLAAGASQVFAPYAAGAFAVLPTGVVVAQANGQPMLSLTLVSQPDQPGVAGDYAVLDIALDLQVPLDAALVAARGVRADATVAPATIELGFARLTQAGLDVTLPKDMTTPAPLGWIAAGARWTPRLDASTGALLKNALLQGTLLLHARLEFTVRGVAPPVAAATSFVPATLIPALLGGSATIGVPQLLARLADPSLPLEVIGGSRAAAAQALCDRILAVWGSFVPAAGADDPPCFAFPGPLPISRMDWDLRTPAEGLRAYMLQLAPLAPTRGMADPSSLVHEISIPPLDLGFRDIVVSANLPPNRAGLPAIGVRISLPPAPPDRPSGIDASAMFTPPGDTARINIRLGPDEPLAYTATTFAIVVAGASVQQLEAPGRPAQGPFLRLQPTDFPLAFAHVTASDRLLAQATVTGALTYAHGAAQAVQPIALQAGTAELSVAAPAAAADAVITLTAVAADGTKVALSPQKPGVVRLDLASFPGYGPHRIAISAPIPAGAMPLLLEFESEDGASQGTAMLTPASPTAGWGYVAGSPFRAGFRFRVKGGTWSAVMAARNTLALNADGTPCPT
jgi:hypothetical protein